MTAKQDTTTDLVARLRDYRTVLGDLSSLAIHPETPGYSTGRVIGITSEAADVIEQLATDVAVWRKSFRQAQERADAAQAKVDRIQETLERIASKPADQCPGVSMEEAYAHLQSLALSALNG